MKATIQNRAGGGFLLKTEDGGRIAITEPEDSMAIGEQIAMQLEDRNYSAMHEREAIAYATYELLPTAIYNGLSIVAEA